jgi:TolA-binding protein
MKWVGWAVFSLLVATTLWGQGAPASNSAPVAPSNPSAPQTGFAGEPMTPVELNAWRMRRMAQLMSELKAMHAKLDEMKANAEKVTDPALKQQLQLDNELWAMMLTHVEEMTAVTPQASRLLNRFGTGQQMRRQPQEGHPQGATPAAPAGPAAPEPPKSAPPSDQP